MNIADRYDLHEIIKELETALQIDGVDFEERDIDVLIRNIRLKISRQYQINLTDYKVCDTEIELSDFRKSVSLFIDNITRLHSKICGYSQIARFMTSSGISLSSVNYLGFTEETFVKTLLALQRKISQPKAEASIQAIKGKLGTVNNCWEKRLCILLVVSHEIGFYELTASIAEVLYQGTFRTGVSSNGYQNYK